MYLDVAHALKGYITPSCLNHLLDIIPVIYMNIILNHSSSCHNMQLHIWGEHVVCVW